MAKKGTATTVTSAEYLYFELEKSRMKRENAMLLLNKSFIFYFAYLIIGVVGFVNHYLSAKALNLLVVLGLLVLIIGTIPFVRTMKKEEDSINDMMDSLKKGK